jgi:hypothetical protein
MRVFFSYQVSSEKVWETFSSGSHGKKEMHIHAKIEWAISPYGACAEITILLHFTRLRLDIFVMIKDRYKYLNL